MASVGDYIVRCYYDGPTCHAKCENSLSQEFVIKLGVRQGSVLSPSLFLWLMVAYWIS